MEFDLGLLLTVVGLSILGGFTFLFVLVGRDLAPAVSLAGPRRWLIVVGLGFGVIALSIKVVAIMLLSRMSLHPEMASLAPPEETAEILPVRFEALPRPAPLWKALPELAPAPADNPTTPAKVALGRALFFETALSLDGTMSCASCHDLARGGADAKPLSPGVGGSIGARNAPSVYNAAFQKRLFWDGRARSLEEQATGPILNPVEMAMPDAKSVEGRLRDIPAYAERFALAFGEGTISIERVAEAIAAFERTLITPDSAYDRFVRGDMNALNSRQLRGMTLFQEIGCIQCHSGPNLSGASLFAADENGLRIFPAVENDTLSHYPLREDKGAAAAGSERAIWRIPSLRNVALTGPYFHNGSVATLREAVRIMAASQRNVLLAEDHLAGRTIVWQPDDARLSVTDRAVLTENDIADIIAFLESLTSDSLKRATAGP
ncbi:MAG: c-type cytochrome [Bradyrhizobium sp.]|uniref:cytochrome-c peroxidase n=1 Tax=Bradyrhizobium sp. TaxID=376 RepID=UPI0025C141D0|nr:cytochrome c peroxidase [Bradyrhizobium sp.]MBI5263576.1 c-type cytochrome [Bradyrhizobium sp.]